MLTALADASSDTCGPKAAALAVMLRAGLPVPDGFVVPFAGRRDARDEQGMQVLRDALARHLGRLGDRPVAVRSSASGEDTAGGSAAGQYESVLGVQGAQAVAGAVRVCWASATSVRATGYWKHVTGDAADGEPDMAVLVQRLVDAEVSGVMFTPARPGDSTRIEAAWGLGLSVVGGTVAPDTYEVAADRRIRRAIARKRIRTDRDDLGVITRVVPEEQQALPTLDDATAGSLADLGDRIACLFGRSQDVEWAISDGRIWILQARPITRELPPLPPDAAFSADALVGVPGAHGTVTGIARILRGPADFPRLRSGEIAVCPYTDPAWTPLFRIAVAVVTETGGVLSHAAIVAREHGIPAVLGIPHAPTRITDGARITVDGTRGTAVLARG